MYNRYIPQPDGTYRRNRMQEPIQAQRNHKPPHTPPPPPEHECCNDPPKPHSKCGKQPPSKQGQSALGFLRQLLPKNLDTGDLLIIILLLLMAGDCAEDQNTAMLTLAMYLFM